MRGEPTNKRLKRIQEEMQDNANSVEKELGRLNNGCLGLSLKDADYATVSNAFTFSVLTFPSTLNILTTALSTESLGIKNFYNKTNECV